MTKILLTNEPLATDSQVATPLSSPPTENASTNTENSSEENPPTKSDTSTEMTGIRDICDELSVKESDLGPEALSNPIVSACYAVTTRSGARAFIREFFNNLPKMLFVLLPLMALVSKVFYPYSKRYYVEHLLFYVHNYSFLFLFCTLLMLAAALLGRFSIPWPEWISLLATLYVAYYFMKSMRVIYRQSRKATVIKWSGLMIIFFMLSGLVVVGLALGTAVMTA